MLAAHSFSLSRPSNRAYILGCSRVKPGRGRITWHQLHASSPATSAITTSEPLRVWLVAKEVERNVQLEVMPDGKGQAVVVVDVEPGSSAAEAGIVRGQRLLGISDPVRDTEIMDMGDRPSLRFVRDTLRMRRMGQVQLVIGDWLNVTDPAWGAVGLTQQQTNSLGEAGASMDDGSSLPSNIRASFLSEGEEENTNMTVGERMAAQYEARERATRQVTDVKKRIAKRAAYMDEVSQRNDSPLVVGLAVAFIAPAAIILAIAAGTGYLDKLYSASLTIN